jgi:hypothetical protein
MSKASAIEALRLALCDAALERARSRDNYDAYRICAKRKAYQLASTGVLLVRVMDCVMS